MFVLFQTLFITAVIALLVFAAVVTSDVEQALGVAIVGMVVLVLISLGLLLPVIALTVRRFHDMGYSGWWYLLTFIPYLGGLVVLVMMCLPSQEGSNKYGSHPYAASEPLPPEPVPVPVPMPPPSGISPTV
jgi:uncharacterized membrane protein YhaH (DUF805 family)